MEDCIFCKIVSGEITSEKIYENDAFIVFLDMNQEVKGHSLVVSKKHFVMLNDFDEEANKLYGDAIQGGIVASLKICGEGITDYNTQTNNGKLALQEVQHSHTHIFPRSKMRRAEFSESK